MDAAECEFLAENEGVDVVPNFSEPTLHLVCGDVGPFEAGERLSVPLWLAVYLKQRHKCRVVAPGWLNVARLEQLVAAEADSELFAEVPPRFIELSRVLVDKAPDDLARVDELKTLLRDLGDNRAAKLRTSVETLLKSGAAHAQINNLTPMEICLNRSFVVDALQRLRQLSAASDQTRANPHSLSL